jgi:hypothetical protein
MNSAARPGYFLRIFSATRIVVAVAAAFIDTNATG